MPKIKILRSELRFQFAADTVDAQSGTIKRCTVAKSGVQATGKFVLIDRNGAITRDEKLSVKKLPIFTDEKTLDTLMAAASDAGNQLKAREDHDDSIGARAGFLDTFSKTTDGRVCADLHLFEQYRNRGIVLETAQKTPDKIGLSIDMTPDFEIAGDHALMRVKVLHAVDIVDEGAITPDGLLLNAEVYTAENERNEAETDSSKQSQAMPDQNPAPTNEEIMSALSAYAKNVADCMAAVAKLAAPAPVVDAEMKATIDRLTASAAKTEERLAAVISDNAKMKKERALFGFRGSPLEKASMSASTAEEIESFNAKKKTYLELVADVKTANSKMSAGAAHDAVRRTPEGKIAFELHLAAKGITVRQTMAA